MISRHPYSGVLRRFGFINSRRGLGLRYRSLTLDESELEFLTDPTARIHLTHGDSDWIQVWKAVHPNDSIPAESRPLIGVCPQPRDVPPVAGQAGDNPRSRAISCSLVYLGPETPALQAWIFGADKHSSGRSSRPAPFEQGNP